MKKVFTIFALAVISLYADSLDQWTIKAPANAPAFFDIVFGQGSFVAVGQGSTVAISTNGLDWETADAPTMISIAYGGGIFLGINGRMTATSMDGHNWTRRTLGSTPIPAAVAYGAGLFVLAGQGGNLWKSTDGINWAMEGTLTNKDFTGISFCGGKFFAFGNGMLLVSTNASNWSVANISANYRFKSVSFGNGVYVTTANTIIFRSSNGIDWEKADFTEENIFKGSFGSGVFVVGGPAKIWTSLDGKNWISRGLNWAGNNYASAAAFGLNRFVVVGQTVSPGQIAVSGPFLSDSAPVLDLGVFRGIIINGIPGRT
ncbi:MAG: hypothetical protein ACTHMT_01615, partial [Verrucomicrobiota bacterium]